MASELQLGGKVDLESETAREELCISTRVVCRFANSIGRLQPVFVFCVAVQSGLAMSRRRENKV